MFTLLFRSRRRIIYVLGSAVRACGITAVLRPRKRLTPCSILIASTAVIFTITLFAATMPQLPREDVLEQKLAAMQIHLDFLNSQYRVRQEELMILERKALMSKLEHSKNGIIHSPRVMSTTVTPEVAAQLKNMTGMKAASGLMSTNLHPLRAPFLYQMMPHLLSDVFSLRPAYHLTAGRTFANVVLGIPTVKRDKENYLLITLTHLVNGLRPEELNSTLIVVLVAELDLAYVLNTAKNIEIMFPTHVASGLIEVISPSPSYYPDLEAYTPTLGDSSKRHRWRTKQNLDTIYLMAYAQPKGVFYMMLEDDIIARKNYMLDIEQFVNSITVSTPDWIILEFCHIGGIGKLFRSSKLLHFITYVQLFYTNMPIDWLVESYLIDNVCGIAKSSKDCTKSRLKVRPKYKTSLFQHIGLYSSLKGKIQKLKNPNFGTVQTFFPNENPPVKYLRTDIEPYNGHTLQKAYEGSTFFWGVRPKTGDLIEFCFQKPLHLKHFLLRSGNVDHISDRFYSAAVQVLPANVDKSNLNSTIPQFVTAAEFDEFGIAEGTFTRDEGPFIALRVRVLKESTSWVILSEINIETYTNSR